MINSSVKAVAMAVLLSTTTGFMASGEAMADNRPVISKGEHAYIALQVQNVMSKHAYLHAAGMNLEEVDTLWVDAKGKFADSAVFASPLWVMDGLQTVRNAYGKENQKNRELALKAMQKVMPELKLEESNLGAGHEWAMHTNTTPVIEVAGDGKTAKGIWYSPGMGLMANIEGDDAKVGSVFFWEKYAGDFILEDGKWKIWHLQMAYDFTPGLPESMIENLSVINGAADHKADTGPMREAGERMEGLPPGFKCTSSDLI